MAYESYNAQQLGKLLYDEMGYICLGKPSRAIPLRSLNLFFSLNFQENSEISHR